MSINDSKSERLKKGNKTELIFEEYCKQHGWDFWQFGYKGQFKKDKQRKKLDWFLFYAPDYIVGKEEQPHYYEVKTLGEKGMLLKEKGHSGYGIWHKRGIMKVYYAIYNERHNPIQSKFIFTDWDSMDKIQKNYQEKPIPVDKNEQNATVEAKTIPKNIIMNLDY